MQQIMERRFDCVRKGFYIPTDLEVGMPGASWGELKKVKTEEALDQLQELING
jgi:hypothetical protein